MDKLLENTVKEKQNARGLAVIIYNTYSAKYGYLGGTIKDGEEAFDFWSLQLSL